MSQIKILDVKIDIISKIEVLERIKQLLLTPKKKARQLVTTNPEFILAAQQNQEFKNILNNSWLSVADGYGIKLAAKYLDLIKNKKKKNRFFKFLNYFWKGWQVAWWGVTKNNKKLNIVKEIITGVDLVPSICKLVSEHSWSANRIFLLGGFEDTPQLTAEKLSQQNPGLQINYSTFEADNLINKINNAKASVLLVALNHPQAQIWINDNLHNLPAVKLAIGVGGAFDYISGKQTRPPAGWQNSYEWLFRLLTQPQRWRRIFSAWLKFSGKIFIDSIKQN